MGGECSKTEAMEVQRIEERRKDTQTFLRRLTPGQYWSNNLGFLPLSSCSCTLCYMKILNLPAFCVSATLCSCTWTWRSIVDLHPCFLAALLNSPWGRISAALPPLRLESMNNKIILDDYNRGDSPLFEFRNKQRGLYVYSALFSLSSTIPSIFVEKLIRKSGKL